MAKRRKRKSVLRKKFEEIIIRLTAVFVAYAFQAVAAGAIVGVHVVKSILMAGLMGIATTFQYFAQSYINDGKMSVTEMNQAFQKTSEKLDTA